MITDQVELEEALFEENEITVMAKEFVNKHPDLSVDVFDVTKNDKIIVTEYAPKLFRKIRDGIVTEQIMYESLIPAANFSAMHNFQSGPSGKSPSFFFFSDNKQLMLKTLKTKERDILFEDKFLIEYYKHIV